MTKKTMKEAQLFSKLLPTLPPILPIVEEIREKYQLPGISPTDDGYKIYLRHEAEFDWDAIHAEILERLRESDLLPVTISKTTINLGIQY